MERANMFLNGENNSSMGYVMSSSSRHHHHHNDIEMNNNNSSQQLQNCFFNPTWENSADQSDPFESAMSSMVSSPAPGNDTESYVLRELIGRLGSVCNSAEISCHTFLVNGNGNGSSSSKACGYTPSPPLNSPPELNLSVMDPHQMRGQGHHHPPAGGPAAFSCFPNHDGLGGLGAQFVVLRDSQRTHTIVPKLDSGKLSRVSSNQSLKLQQDGNSGADQSAEFGDSRENSSVSEQIPCGENGANSRKRKSISKGKGKGKGKAKDANVAVENNESGAKRSKLDEDGGRADQNGADAAGNGSKKESDKDDQKPPEPPKDYIHVRARRGQATDAHSLAERVRREKISQRMKLLQDLVPGCNKVTGKAVMLDEIINYVQSLQRQVEFLSMKLASINPRMDVNIEALLSKHMFQPRDAYPPDASASALPFSFQLQQGQSLHGQIPHHKTKMHLPMNNNHLNSAMGKNPSLQLHSLDAAASQASTFWEDDLQTVVYGQNQTQDLHDLMSQPQMKPEL